MEVKPDEMRAGVMHVVGGGRNQMPLVALIQEMGYSVLVTDKNESPPCRGIADFFAQADTVDLEATLHEAKQHSVVGVISDQTDVAMPTVAFVAEELGLTGIGYEAALRFTNKYLMRMHLKATVPEHTPDFQFCRQVDRAIALCRGLKQPEKYIVKPINSQGSKGVYQLPRTDFERAVTKSFLEANGNGVLIERFIEGTEYSVEAYKQGNQIHNLAVTKKYQFEENGCIDYRNTFLGDVSKELEEKLFCLNSRVLHAMELAFGVTHAEYKVTSAGDIYVIEVAARGGGGGISSMIIPYLTGFEPNRALINHLMRADVPIPHIGNYQDRFAVLRFFKFDSGPVSRVLVNQSAIDKALYVQLDIQVGDKIQKVRDSRDRVGYFIVASDSRSEVLALEEELICSVQIE